MFGHRGRYVAFGYRVARVLDAIATVREYAATIVMDNGTELTAVAMLCWARDRKVCLHCIQPRKTNAKRYIESFNGRFRVEFPQGIAIADPECRGYRIRVVPQWFVLVFIEIRVLMQGYITGEAS